MLLTWPNWAAANDAPSTLPLSDNGNTMRTIVDLPEAERAQLAALCRQRGLSRAEALRLWLEQQERPHISVISWIEVLVACREGESGRVEAWLDTFPCLPLNDAIALKSVRLRQRHGLKIPDAIILATARCADLNLASRNSRDVPLTLGGVVHPDGL